MGHLENILLNGFLMLSIVTIIVTPWIIRALERRRLHRLLGKAMENGITPAPELLKALTETSQPAQPRLPALQRDLRTGILWLSTAVGIGTLAASIVAGHDPRHLYLPLRDPLAALGLAGLPAAIGVGYLILWLINRRQAS